VSRAELVSFAEFARIRGVAKSAVTRAIKEGRITPIGEKLDPVVANIQWDANTRAKASNATDHDRGQRTATGGGGGGANHESEASSGYNANRARREAAEAIKAEVEAAKAANSVMDKEKGVRGAFTAFRGLRDVVMPIGRRLAPRLAVMTDVREIAALVDEAHRKALSGWAARALADYAQQAGATGMPLPDVLVEPLPDDLAAAVVCEDGGAV
jgi:hypothetical protein